MNTSLLTHKHRFNLLILTVTLLWLVPFTGQAQTRNSQNENEYEFVIGDFDGGGEPMRGGNWGSSTDYSGTTNTAQGSPYGRYYGWEYKIFLYRASYIDFSGTITKITFYPQSTKSTGTNTSSVTINGVADDKPFQIWMKEVADDYNGLTTSDKFSDYASGATKVFSGNIPATTSGSANTITLTNSFTHSSDKSLLILVRSVVTGTGDGACNVYYKSPSSAPNVLWEQQQDSSDPGADCTADRVSTTLLPCISFTYSAVTNYTISTAVSPSDAGSVTGGGSYTSGTNCTLSATANPGYAFSHWSKNGTQVSTNNPYTFSVSAAETYTANFVEVYLMNNTSVTTCSGKFYDSGGPNGGYGSSEGYTKTFYPGTSGKLVSMTFTSFETENSYDYLHIYDGTSTSATQIGTYSGTTSPGTVIASNCDGALTFYFTSDGSVTKTGWEATISCVNASPTPIYEINDEDDWDAFCCSVNQGYAYSGKTVTLKDDISVTKMVPGDCWASSGKRFGGTFDGGGHTITFNYTATSDFTGLFRYTYNATIKNLRLEGTITSSYPNVASFIGMSQGTTNIENCISNVTINSTNTGVAGMVAGVSNTIYFKGCAFTGSLNGTSSSQNGGFVGRLWNDDTHSYTNCLFSPTSISSTLTNGYTFDVYTGSSFTNCYYTQAFGTTQGKLAHTITGDGVTVQMQGTASTYSCSGITVYSSNTGMIFDSHLYAGNSDAVKLKLSCTTSADYTLGSYSSSSGTLSSGTITGTDDLYTLTMANADAEITAILLQNIEIEIGSGTGTDNGSNLPTNIYYNNSLTQQIYTPNEIGYTGTIKSISFYTTNAYDKRNLDIYLSATTNSTLSSFENVSTTKVFSGEYQFTSGTWNTITFTTPYEYTGGYLLLTVDDNTGSYASSRSFYTYSTGENRALYINSDGTNYATSTASNYSGSSNSQYNNHIKMKIDAATELPSYTINTSVAPSTSAGSVTGNGTYTAGTYCTLSATGNTTTNGIYVFTNWTKNGSVVSTDNPYTFSVTEDAAYTANFEEVDIYLMNNSDDVTVTNCSGLFCDEGGLNGDYFTTNLTRYKTFYPGTDGKMLKVVFETFKTESSRDKLTIYDGVYDGSSSMAEPDKLLNEFSGESTIPGGTTGYTATNCDGALTFKWATDGSVAKAGWSAVFSCANPSTATYTISKNNPSNGTLSVSANSATACSVITITATPSSGYALVNLTVTPSTGNAIAVNSIGNNKYTFDMPASNVTINATFASYATVLYTDDFSSNNWTFVNDGCTNQWSYGSAPYNGSDNCIFISNNSGTSNAYNTNSISVVYAYRYILFEENATYKLSFNLKQKGESTYDCVGAMLYDFQTTPITSTSFTSNSLESYPSGYSQFLIGAGLSASDGSWVTQEKVFTISDAGIYKLTFCWKNDGSVGENPPAAIDNVKVERMYKVTATVAPSGVGSVSGTGTYEEYSDAIVEATSSNSDYVFAYWEDIWSTGSSYIRTNNPLTLGYLEEDHTLVAHFAPLKIGTTAQWEEFCDAVDNGFSYYQQTVTMTADVSTGARMAGVIVGEQTTFDGDYTFRGTFDGQGYTLNIALNSDGAPSDNFYYCAPFRKVYGATFQNLKVSGTINTDKQGAAGIAGWVYGATFTNCVSNVTITNNYTGGDASSGGFVSNVRNTTSFTGCAFTGQFVSTQSLPKWGGFVGWNNSTTNITNCVYAPSANPSGISTSNCATFARNGASITNSYYTQTLGTAQGKQAYTVTGDGVTVTMRGTGDKYTLSGITPPASGTNGMIYDYYDTGSKTITTSIIAGNSDNVSLTLGHATPATGYELIYTSTNGALSDGPSVNDGDDDYTLNKGTGNTVISASTSQIDYNITYTNDGNGTVSGPAVAHSGETVNLTVTPATGYEVNAVTYNGTAITPSSGSYSFTMPAANVTVNATFKLSGHTITVTAEPAGSGTFTFTGSDVISSDANSAFVKPNGSVTITATTATGYTFMYWNEGGSVVSTDYGTYSLTGVSTPHTITAHFVNQKGDGGDCAGISEDVDLGSGSQLYGPFDAFQNYNYYQILYPGSSLPTNINSISFKYRGENAITGKDDIDIYLAETTATSQTSGYLNRSALTLVYSGAMNFAANAGWVEFEFNQNGGKFTHSTSKNLIVVINDKSNHYVGSNSGERFYYATDNSNWTTLYTSVTGHGYFYFKEDGTIWDNYTDAAAYAAQLHNYPIVKFCDKGSWAAVVDESSDVPLSGYTTDVSGNVTISNKEGLAWLISVVNGLNSQTANNFSGKTVTLAADIDMSAHTWVPIGTREHPFSGTFNGNGHSITGLTRNSEFPHQGLFGYTDGANINGVMVSAEFTGNSITTGTVAGTMAGSSAVSNVSGTATLTGGAQTTAMGGIVGANSGSITNSYSNVTYSGTATNKGGLAGTNGSGAISNCYAVNTGIGAVLFGSNSSETIQYSYTKASNDNEPGSSEFTSAVTYRYGDYTSNNTVNSVPMVDTLNSRSDANYKWIRPKNSSINGGYPVLVKKSTAGDGSDARAVAKADGALYYGTAASLITDHGSKSGAEIYVYGNGNLGNTAPSTATLFIDENASVLSDNTNITATVGVTIDNSKAAIVSGSLLGRDWHCFATPLKSVSLGINYTNYIDPVTDEIAPIPYGADSATVHSLMTFNGGYFPDAYGLNAHKSDFDFYDFSEPDYHWINLKRNPISHYHSDLVGTPPSHASISYDDNDGKLKKGNGYLLAIGNATAANKEFYLSATGVLNNDATVTAPVTNTTTAGHHLDGYNFLGNPFQSYLDFNRFAITNATAIWGSDNSDGYMAYMVYDADEGRFNEYLFVADGSSEVTGQSFSQGAAQNASRYIHPHQSFFIVKKTADSDYNEVQFTTAMRNIEPTTASAYRDAQPNYPLVNLFCTDNNGKQEVSVIEVERPRAAGSLKMKDMLNGKANMYIHWNNEDFSSMFLEGTPEYVPVWFKSVEEGVFTMTWSTANDNFGYLHLIDNLTGNDIDMLATDSYAFQSKPSDSKARFRLVFSPLGIDEETTTEQGENFAFINGNELVVNGEGELSFIDLNGRILATEYVSGQQSHIAMPKVAVGMYMLRLSNSDGVKVQKIVVRK